jgi:hypothetical protein
MKMPRMRSSVTSRDTVTAEIGDMRMDHQNLNHEAGVALKSWPGGAALTVFSQLRLGAAALTASLTGGLVRLRLCRLLHATRFDIRPAGAALQAGNLVGIVSRNSATCSNRATAKF